MFCDCIWPVRCGLKLSRSPCIVNEAIVTSSDPGLRLDLGIRGFWQSQVEVLVDVCVVDMH